MTPLRKRVKRAARFAAIRLALALASLLPLGAIDPLGRVLGRLGFALLRRERQRALASLELAYRDAAPGWRESIARAMFQNLARGALEIALVEKIDRRLEQRVEFAPGAEAIFRDALARGRGAIFVTAHLGNWELLARRLARTGLPCSSIAKEANEPRLTAYLARLRARGGLDTIWRGEPGAVKKMLRALRSGRALGMLIDQDTPVQGVFVEFFGRPAFTPRAAADLVLRTGAAALVGFTYREGAKHLVEIAEFAPLVGEDAIALTQRFTRELERAIRAHPDQWVWMHQRWKTLPPAELNEDRGARPSATG